MAKPATVDEYLDQQPEAARAILTRVRAAIRRGMPQAEESIAYNMPTYKVGPKATLYFAGWKSHFSIYPAGDDLLKAFAGELDRYKVEKATIRFPYKEGAPEDLIERIARHRFAAATR